MKFRHGNGRSLFPGKFRGKRHMVFQHGKSQLIRWKISGDPFRGPVIPDHLQRSIQSLGRRFPRDAYHRHRIHLWHHDGHIYRHRIAFFQLLVSPVLYDILAHPPFGKAFPKFHDRYIVAFTQSMRCSGDSNKQRHTESDDTQWLSHRYGPPFLDATNTVDHRRNACKMDGKSLVMLVYLVPCKDIRHIAPILPSVACQIIDFSGLRIDDD